jgi:hypothetical protein
LPNAIQGNGSDITILNNTFYNVEEDIDLGTGPNNVLIQNNTSPALKDLRAYFVWDSGSNDVILGNTVADSYGEHVIRIGSGSDILIAYNSLSNVTAHKAAINIQSGAYAYVYDNYLPIGDIQTGPLSATLPSSLAHPEAAYDNIVIDSNTIYDALTITPGTDGLMIRNNTFLKDGNVAITIDAQESVFGRVVKNVYILNNTVVDSGPGSAYGGFLKMSNGVAQNIVMDNNLFVDPNFIVGDAGGAIVYVDDSSLESFSQIQNNIWDVPQTESNTNGGYFYMSPGLDVSAGYLTPAEWEATGVPTGDQYSNVTLTETYDVTIDGTTAGSDMPLPVGT